MNTQEAPFPTELAELVDRLEYRPGWTVTLGHVDRGQGSAGLTLDVLTRGYDAYHPDRGASYRVHHYFPVPPAAYHRRSWQRWLFDCLLLVERHEAMEFFTLVYEGDFTDQAGNRVGERRERPYAPNHGPGWDPYVVTELTTRTDRRTSFRGEVAE